MAMLGIRFDLRVPGFAEVTHAQQYAACIDMCEWADGLGLDFVVLSEHHGTDDGYMPAPVPLAAAILGRTKRISVNIAAVLVPFHDPVRLAEQLAVVSLSSGGRIGFVAGLGYRYEEFEMAGIDRRDRGRLLEEGVEVMQKAWTGEPFEYRGRTVVVTPKPEVPPMVLVGGSTEIAARRAARLGCGFFPAVGDPKLAEIYNDECENVGFGGGFVNLPQGPGFVMVSDDPDKTWDQIGRHALFDAQTYDRWQAPGQRSEVDVKGAQSPDDVRRTGVYQVLTPDECVALAEKQGDFGSVLLHPLMGGIAPDVAWEGLHLFEEKVLPRLRPGG
jgi:alkanesulfonate monooxygenase SsuD/methylene tetrahydromethanopterin reductase-like flavin-dependent oxidoreductase (luciferase family)